MILAADISDTDKWEVTESAVKMMFIGVRAISQHYGPGSEYLDVTRSLGVALWFALHRAEPITGGEAWRTFFKDHDPPDQLNVDSWVRYCRYEEKNGWLYVFDVPRWSGEEEPKPGELVDLLGQELPAPLFASERIKIQSACLIKGDPALSGGDLSHLLTCEPIPVAWPMEDVPEMLYRPEDIFPDPGRDAWYARFLSVPLSNQISPESKDLLLSRPLPVSVYLPHAWQRLGETTRRIRKLDSALNPYVVAALCDLPKQVHGWLGLGDCDLNAWRVTDATLIKLEGPVISSAIPPSSGIWNQGVLGRGMADGVAAADLQGDSPLGSVSLENVYVEVSVLEHARWEAMGELEQGHGGLLTGIWLLRRGDQYVMTLLSHAFPSSQIKIIGPVLYVFDPSLDRFMTVQPDGGGPEVVDGNGVSEIAFFPTLALIRAVSPGTKVDPIPMLEVKDEAGLWTVGIKVQRGPEAKLWRTTERESGRSWYVPRHTANDLPYHNSVLTIPLVQGGAKIQNELAASSGHSHRTLKVCDIMCKSPVRWADMPYPTISQVVESQPPDTQGYWLLA
jgi:hypothetical protein